MQPLHSYAATSSSFVNSLEGNGRGTSVQFFLVHAGSRHALQVLHSGRVHAGCTQSLQRSSLVQGAKSLLHFSFLQVLQTRNVQEGHRKELLSTSSSLHALIWVCFCLFGFSLQESLLLHDSSRHVRHLGQAGLVQAGYKHFRQIISSLRLGVLLGEGYFRSEETSLLS